MRGRFDHFRGSRLLLAGIFALTVPACTSEGGAAGEDAEDAADVADVSDAVDATDVTDADAGGQVITHAGVSAYEEDGVVTLANARLTLTAVLSKGHIAVRDAEGTLVLVGASSQATIAEAGSERTLRMTGKGERTWQTREVSDPLGEGLALVLSWTPEGGGPGLETVIELRGEGYVTATTTVRWPEQPEATRVLSISPIVATGARDGGLFVGADPEGHVVLDNGADLLFDFEAHAFAPGGFPSLFNPPGNVANWDMAIYDPASKRSVTSGFLSSTRGVGLIATDYSAPSALEDAGRKGLTRFEGFAEYIGGRAPIADGEGAALTSEIFYLDVDEATPQEGLEAYADRYALRIGKTTTTDVPTGWNSWGGGYGSGGLGTNIDEALMLENLELAAQDFKPYGMKYFLLDDGWEDHEGDWNNHPDRFPDHDGVNGMKWFADQVKARGMIPGVWISPFGVEHDSALMAEHPEWMADLDPMYAGFVPTGKVKVIDFSNPEVLDWLEALFKRITQDWGYKWIKLDFSYYAFAATNLWDEDVSVTEAYRNALMRIREAIGPDVFFMTISGQGLCFDMADGNRVGLDNEPWWGGNLSADVGYKVIYRTVARRYYMNHRIFINHPDLVYYRPQFGLTLNEARMWTSAVALTGGIVKLGDTYTALHDHPEWRALVTPTLPVYPRSARPLDLFEHDFPEVWSLDAEREGRTWRVVGLMNWGENRELPASLGSTAYQAEQTRDYTLALEDIGLDPSRRHLVFDAWEQTWEWNDTGEISATLEPRTDTVLIVREEPDVPAIVATSRHLMGGAVEVHDEAWSDADGTLTATIDTVPGDPISVYVAPAGHDFSSSAADGSTDLATEESDGLLEVSFVPSTAGTTVRVELTP